MSIRLATAADIPHWAALRAQLWADTTLDQHRAEAALLLSRPPGAALVLLDVAPDADQRGFAEDSLRHDYVNGCDTSPVAFLEGIFVRAPDRGKGIGRRLLRAVQTWARDNGCTELASDAHLDNIASHRFHAAVGFAETERVVYFRKRI